jgi:NAD(P)-dependent dehydrogenase (short-subunit alcohol dehydrogenase family)
MKSFADKVAAITGASSGIGRALAVELAKEKCHLALSDVNEPGLAETAALARAHGVNVTTARVDVSRRDEVHAWADDVVRAHGKVNLVFNNAGVALGATIEGVRYEDFEWIVGINFWGVVYGTKAFLPHLKASGEGHVVNVSSVFGLIAIPTQGTYNAAKFAVRGMTEALREELALSGAPVSATCVHPGGIKTNIARAARIDPSARQLTGVDIEESQRNFDRIAATTPEAAAKTILRGVRRNARRVLIGRDAYAIDFVQRLLPTGYQFLVEKFGRRLTS